MEPDLHCDAEDPWPDGLGEPGDFRVHGICEHCGCAGVTSAVRFVPVHADGGGVLTTEEIADVIGQARLRILEAWEQTEAQGLEPRSGALPEDVVMQIDGRRDGTFRAVIIASGGADGQSYARYGRGSEYTGARGWRHGLALSRHTVQDTRPEEREEGLIAYEGERGILNFSLLNQEKSLSPEAKEARRIRRGMRDRTSATTSWQRHQRASPRPPEGEGEGEGSDDGDQAAE